MPEYLQSYPLGCVLILHPVRECECFSPVLLARRDREESQLAVLFYYKDIWSVALNNAFG